MATVIIGKKVIDLPELNFKSIKRIWPLVKDISETEDLVALMEVASQVLSIAMERSDQPMTVDDIENNLLGSEIPGIQVAVEELLVDSGLLKRTTPGEEPGEAQGAESAPSTETGTDLSPSLSPQVAVEVTGTP